MNTWKKSATGFVAVLAIGGLAACSDDSSSSSSDSTTASSSSMSETSGMSGAMTTSAAASAAGMVGPGCAAYAEQVPDGPGSVAGMAAEPVATAASNNPLLKTLVSAVSGQLNPAVNLVDTLNNGQLTVFAPVDEAFAKLPPETVTTLGTPEGADQLSKVLTYHVVPGRIAPDAIAGSQTTVEGAPVTVTGSGDTLKVNDANVICGGVQTANATVYLIDTVLMPPS
ncbi:fasciclin domain-containing protein [Skermania piniformis]|uniref:Fasciclin domain-containing protein n=1 Tax=Skermania pinensis TaxID=39122 RepID=A0ABX8S7R2_9ACTN|nr:fasciclin domain-containing protein [Skermania piniformis]QXQ13852.1 fasciclin domain-containing protein [Skermania piniformis]